MTLAAVHGWFTDKVAGLLLSFQYPYLISPAHLLCIAPLGCDLCVAQADLPDLLEALDGSASASVPEALLRDMEEVNSIGGSQHLKEVRGLAWWCGGGVTVLHAGCAAPMSSAVCMPCASDLRAV